MAKRSVREAAVKKARKTPRFDAVRGELRRQAEEARILSMDIEKFTRQATDLNKKLIAKEKQVEALEEAGRKVPKALADEEEELNDELMDVAIAKAEAEKMLRKLPGVSVRDIRSAAKERYD